MADNNIYLNAGQQRQQIRDVSKDLSFLTNGKKVLAFPPGLGGDALSADIVRGKHTIPFTVFMPYKRNKLASGLYSVQQALGADEIFKSLPTPFFAIALPTPTSALKSQYQATYSEFNIGQGIGTAMSDLDKGTLGKAIRGENISASDFFNSAAGAVIGAAAGSLTGGGKAITAGSAAAGALFGASGLANQAVVAGWDAIGKGIESLGGSADLKNALGGVADNPFTENVFKNMGFREHSFSFTFMPKNAHESRMIDDIITIFKYCMMPKPSGGALGGKIGAGTFFEFPYEFQITHSVSDTTFTLLPSVLTTLDVDYSGGMDTPKLFVPENGAQYPSKITLTMSFKEMVLLNRDRLVQDKAGLLTDANFNSQEAPAGGLRFRF